MPILDPIRFHGTLSSPGAVASVDLAAGTDEDGNLTIALDPITPARTALLFAPQSRPLDDQSTFTLEGASDAGWRFPSKTFHVSHWSHPEGRVEIEGSCGFTEFSRDVRADHNDMRAWFFRKLATLHGIERQTPLGRLIFAGYLEGADQAPQAVLAIHANGSESQSWWDESKQFLTILSNLDLGDAQKTRLSLDNLNVAALGSQLSSSKGAWSCCASSPGRPSCTRRLCGRGKARGPARLRGQASLSSRGK